MGELKGYELSKAWFDFAFENPGKVRPAHASLYFYIVDLWNRLGQSKEFGLPTEVAMMGASIGNYKTYIAALNDLSEYGFIKIVTRSKNQYTAKKIALVKNSKALTKALTKAVIEALPEAPYQSTTQSTTRSSAGINKPVNLKPETLNKEPDLIFPFHSIEFMEAWEQLVKEPKWRKKTHTALQGSLNALKECDESDAIAAIRKSINGNYQGIFPERQKQKVSPQQTESRFERLSKM